MTETTPEYHEDKAGLILSNVKQDINNNIGVLDDPEWQAMAGLQVARAQAHASLAQSLRLKELCWGKS